MIIRLFLSIMYIGIFLSSIAGGYVVPHYINSQIQIDESPANTETLFLRAGEKKAINIDKRLIAEQNMAEIQRRFHEDNRAAIFNDEYCLIMQFEKLLNFETRSFLSTSGIRFLEYIPENAYLVRMPVTADLSLLISEGLIGYYIPTVEDKMPDYFFDYLNENRPDIPIQIMARPVIDISPADLSGIINDLPGNPSITMKANNYYFAAEMNYKAIMELARLPFISFIAPYSDSIIFDCPPVNEPSYDNLSNRGDYHNTSSRANYIKSTLPGYPNLNGEFVVVGVGDAVYWAPTHLDMWGRHLVLDPDQITANPINHGIHTSGTVGGNGNRIPRYEGIATKAIVYTALTSAIYDLGLSAPEPMVITSNSWSKDDPVYGSDFFANMGRYNIYSQEIDTLLRYETSLLSVHSAGNYGGQHDGYPNNYATMNPSYGSAKNTLVVGRKSRPETFSTVSSYGPTFDGRIKPDIISENRVTATIEFNHYDVYEGSSMSTPTVAGIAALLYQGFRNLNSGTDPEGALIKAALMNSADYLVDPGPAFSAGYGKVNARRAFQIIENQQYFNGSLDNLEEISYFINVPTTIEGKNIASIKIMLYWHDYKASLYAVPSLVNNLDLAVNYGATTFLPWVLDHTPSNVELPATTGVDNLNNTEQVMINNPLSGEYEISIIGTAVPFGPQEFYIVYSFILEELTLTYPIGGEKLFSGQTKSVFWDSHNIGSANAIDQAEYSTNDGLTWFPITHGLIGGFPGASKPWLVPELPLTEVIARVQMDGNASVSEPFVVSEHIELNIYELDENQIELVWNNVEGAYSYNLLQLFGYDSWVIIASTEDTSMISDKSACSLDSIWLSVQATDNTQSIFSQRAEAVACDFGNSFPDAKNDTVIASPFPIYLQIYAMDNDVDADGDELVIADVTTPSYGWVVNHGGKFLKYYNDGVTPPDFTMFSYTVCDGRGGSDIATVFISTDPFKCGDANGDGSVNIGDVVYIANYVFHNSECEIHPPIGCPPDPYVTGDVNCDGNVNIGDAVYLGNIIFRPGSPEPCASCP